MTTDISWDIFKLSLRALLGTICISHTCTLFTADGTGARRVEQHMDVW